MNATIITRTRPVTLVGGGPLDPADLQLAYTLAPTIVAADGGADAALGLGHVPDAVVGDFDSISKEARGRIPLAQQHPQSDQDTTDFEKTLAAIEAPVCLAVGFMGGRLDHQLAVLHCLLRHPDRPCILIGETEITFLAPPQLRLETQAGQVVSLFPMAEVTGKSTGLAWPIEGLRFHPLDFIGTSNRATGPAMLAFDRPAMICILPKDLIQQVSQQLAQHAARWPAL